MKRLLHKFLITLVIAASFTATNAQSIYWREGFTTWTGPTADPSTAAVPGTATADAGTWGHFGVWLTGGGAGTNCPYSDGTLNPHIRSTSAVISNASAFPADSAYLITPLVNNGISQVSIIRSRQNRRLTIWWTPDVSITTTNWTLAGVGPKSASSPLVAGCSDTIFLVNQPTAKRLQFRFERAGNSDVDSIILFSSTPLPVKFGSVSASEALGKVKVNWNIFTELNTDRYEIERSANGTTFTTAGTVAATQAGVYNWLDLAPARGLNFYRIKAIDKDGAAMYSSVLKLSVGNKVGELTISPNPVKGGQLNLQVANLEKGTYSVSVFNTVGQVVFTKTLELTGGSTAIPLQLAGSVKTGVYNLQLRNGAEVISKKLVVE